MQTRLEMFGHRFRRARRPHKCWACGETITAGERYFVTTGKLDGAMWSVKHCRKTCECTAEMIDQNPQTWPSLLYAECVAC